MEHLEIINVFFSLLTILDISSYSHDRSHSSKKLVTLYHMEDNSNPWIPPSDAEKPEFNLFTHFLDSTTATITRRHSMRYHMRKDGHISITHMDASP